VKKIVKVRGAVKHQRQKSILFFKKWQKKATTLFMTAKVRVTLRTVIRAKMDFLNSNTGFLEGGKPKEQYLNSTGIQKIEDHFKPQTNHC